MTTVGMDRLCGLATRVLLLVFLAVAILGFVRFAWFTRQPEPMLQPPEALAPFLTTFPETGSVAPSADIVERPLFWVSRRPPQALEPEVVVVEPEEEFDEDSPPASPGVLDDARLLGVFSSMGRAGAILSVKGERRRLIMNEAIEGWELVSIMPTRAVFSGMVRGSGLQRQELELEHAGVAPRPEQ